MTFDENVKRLVQYGIESGLVPEEERIYTTNQLLELFGEEEYTEPETEFKDVDLEEVLEVASSTSTSSVVSLPISRQVSEIATRMTTPPMVGVPCLTK